MIIQLYYTNGTRRNVYRILPPRCNKAISYTNQGLFQSRNPLQAPITMLPSLGRLPQRQQQPPKGDEIIHSSWHMSKHRIFSGPLLYRCKSIIRALLPRPIPDNDVTRANFFYSSKIDPIFDALHTGFGPANTPYAHVLRDEP